MYQPVVIYRRCTQRTICFLYGKRQLTKTLWGQAGGCPTPLNRLLAVKTAAEIAYTVVWHSLTLLTLSLVWRAGWLTWVWRIDALVLILQDTILDTLTPDDVRVLIEFIGENHRRGNFERVFPTSSTRKYHRYFEQQRYYNLLLDAWCRKYSRTESAGQWTNAYSDSDSCRQYSIFVFTFLLEILKLETLRFSMICLKCCSHPHNIVVCKISRFTCYCFYELGAKMVY